VFISLDLEAFPGGGFAYLFPVLTGDNEVLVFVLMPGFAWKNDVGMSSE
jgi:hypothetical protein